MDNSILSGKGKPGKKTKVVQLNKKAAKKAPKKAK
jgi:hypothetical protein